MNRPRKGEYRDLLHEHIGVKRIREMREAVESICDKILGVWNGPVSHAEREQPWSSARAALAEIVLIASDGYEMAGVNDPERLKYANEFGVGSQVRAGAIDKAHRRVERVREVLMALDCAFPEQGEYCTGDQARSLLLYRFGAGKTLGQTTEQATEIGLDLTDSQVSSITRTGYSAVRQYLSVRGLIPPDNRGNEMGQDDILPWDLQGWEEIARALKCSTVTARAYENDGMPVRRFRGRVVARYEELEAWLKGQAGISG